ncbi:MAG: hypothetical protein ACKOOL_13060 [Novosphingobium sp.]
MARRTASPGLSPKMLKHFAAATVVLTGLLAVFASGEEWGAQAQVNAIEAKNQLAATEAEKLGTKKVRTTLKVANNVGGGGFGNDEGDVSGGNGGGGGGGFAAAPAVPAAPASLRTGARKNPQWSANPLDPTRPPQPPGSAQEPAQTQPSAPPTPTAQDLSNITASSARRSGGSPGGD